jgi:hypothetical protein
LKEYDPSKAPLPSRIVPDPSCNDRCHLASAVRMGISRLPPRAPFHTGARYYSEWLPS